VQNAQDRNLFIFGKTEKSYFKMKQFEIKIKAHVIKGD
jgi:hypothetical protein